MFKTNKHLKTLSRLVAVISIVTASPVLAKEVKGLRTADEFAGIENKKERSRALFNEMGKVFKHPRCVNCHPVSDSPLQGDKMKIHTPPVTRGESNFGAPGMRCTVCHSDENVPFAGSAGSIPGHELWHLAPKSMGWVGVSLAGICEQIKDKDRNGGKSLAELHEHNAKDGLVGWGWKPGEGRQPAPGTQEIFGELTKAWIESGAHCPEG